MDSSRHTSQTSENTLVGAPNSVQTMKMESSALPKLQLDLRTKKIAIAINWGIILFSSCIVPLVLYFALRYGAKQDAPVYLGVSTALMGVTTLYSYFTRLYRLLSSKYNCLPLGQRSRSGLDFFQWDFSVSFLLITAVIVISVSLPPKNEDDKSSGTFPRLTSSILCVFLYDLCIQILLTNILVLAKVRCPFRFSSVPKGNLARPAIYFIVEDIVAVDGSLGQEWRRQWNERYLASHGMRKLLLDLGWIWSLSGLGIAALLTGLIFSPSVTSHDAAWAIGWTVPWIWAGLTTIFTFAFVKRRLEAEHRHTTV